MRARLALLYLLVTPTGAGATQPVVRRPPGGVPRARRPPLELHGRARALFARWDSAQTPGCVAQFDMPGTRVRVAVGRASVELGVANADTTRFEVASVSKQVTAAAVFLLAREGRLDLDADVRVHLPRLTLPVAVSARQLLAHTSGVRDIGGLLLLRDGYGVGAGTVVSTDEVWSVTARQRGVSFVPGTRQVYSNTGFLLAAALVEQLSGEPFASFTRRRFFAPLGMTRTAWRAEPFAPAAGRAQGYAADSSGWQRREPVVGGIGHTGLVTTAGDLQRWNAALATGTIAGGPAVVRAMEAPVQMPDSATGLFASGVMTRRVQGRTEVGLDGGTEGYAAFAGRYPDERAYVAVLCNDEGANATALARALATLVMEARPRRPRGTTPSTTVVQTSAQAPLAPPAAPGTERGYPSGNVAGLWVDTVMGRVLRLSARGDSVAVGNVAFPPVGAQAFAREGVGRIDIVPDATRVRPLAIVTANVRGERTTYLPGAEEGDINAHLAYEGRYESEELGVAYDVRATKAGISVRIASPDARVPFAFLDGHPLELRAVRPDWFIDGPFTFRFVSSATGRAARLLVSHERARGLAFRRSDAGCVPDPASSPSLPYR